MFFLFACLRSHVGMGGVTGWWWWLWLGSYVVRCLALGQRVRFGCPLVRERTRGKLVPVHCFVCVHCVWVCVFLCCMHAFCVVGSSWFVVLFGGCFFLGACYLWD